MNRSSLRHWQEQPIELLSSTVSLIRDLSLEQSMPADEKAHSSSMLVGGILSRKLQAFSVYTVLYKPLPPPPENRHLFFDYRRNIVT